MFKHQKKKFEWNGTSSEGEKNVVFAHLAFVFPFNRRKLGSAMENNLTLSDMHGC